MTDEKQHTNGPPEDIPSEPTQQPQSERRTRVQRREAATATAAPIVEQEPKPAEASVGANDVQPVEEKIVTRKEQRQEKTPKQKPEKLANEETEEDTKRVRWVQLRILPIYVRIVIVLVMLVVAVIVGAMIGYSVLGNGSAMDIFQKETWMHIFDIMSGKE